MLVIVTCSLLTVSLLSELTSIIPLSKAWQSGGIKCGMWNTPLFTFSRSCRRLSWSKGKAPWKVTADDGERKDEIKKYWWFNQKEELLTSLQLATLCIKIVFPVNSNHLKSLCTDIRIAFLVQLFYPNWDVSHLIIAGDIQSKYQLHTLHLTISWGLRTWTCEAVDTTDNQGCFKSTLRRISLCNVV